MTHVPEGQAVRKCHYAFRPSRQNHAVCKIFWLSFLCKLKVKATACMLLPSWRFLRMELINANANPVSCIPMCCIQNSPRHFQDTFWYCFPTFFPKSENLISQYASFSASLYLSTVGLGNINLTFGKWKRCYLESRLLLPTYSSGTCHCLGGENVNWKTPYASKRAVWIPCATRSPKTSAKTSPTAVRF